MSPHENLNSGRQEMLAALCLIGEGEAGRKLFAFAGKKEQPELDVIAGRICEGEKVKRKELLGRIQKIAQLNRFSLLEEIHPGWIMEKLQNESPRVIGLLCRFLSGEKAQYLIGHLSVEDRNRLPKLNDSYLVAPEIVEIVRHLVEKKLNIAPLPRLSGNFSFTHIALLRSEDLRIFFWDLGLEEIRRAFHDVDPQMFRAFLARFSTKEAKEIRERIESGGKVTVEEKREAQRHLVSLTLEHLPSDALLREIGYSVFSRALFPAESAWVERICQKLSPTEGYRLKRVLQEPKSVASPEQKREEIMKRLFSLAKSGLIRYYWRPEKQEGK